MAQKNFFHLVLVMLVVVTSCTDDYVSLPTGISSVDTLIVEKDLAVKPVLAHNLNNQKNTAEDRMTSSVTFYQLENGEVVDSFAHKEYPTMVASIKVEKTNYTITEDLVDCKLVDYNISRYFGAIENSYEFEEVDTVNFYFNDDQVVRCPVRITSQGMVYRNKYYFMPSDTLLSAKLLSVKNVEPQTRAMYVKDILNTEYTVELTFGEKNCNNSSKTQQVVLVGYATRKVLAEDDIAKVETAHKNREVIDDNTEKCSFDYIVTMKSGEKNTVTKSVILNREFKGIATYDKFVSGFNYGNATNGKLTNGTNEAKVKGDESWSIWGRTDSYSADVNNGETADAINTSYSLYHERATYKDSHVTVDFGYETVSVNEVNTSVASASSDKSGYDKKVLTNEVRTSYIGYTQNISENVNLYKTAKSISGYDIQNAKLTISDDEVVATLDFITIFNTGEKETDTQKLTVARLLNCTSNWSATATNANQTTGTANVSVKSSQKQEGFWSYISETRTITTVATLAGSTQTNSWTAVVPNRITFTREGKSYTFGEIGFTAKEMGATVKVKSDKEESTVYSYTDKLDVTFGSNTVSTTAPGTITVAKELKGDFPAEWGKFVKAISTLSVSEDAKDWVYTWSIHFEHGTLPVVIRRDNSHANSSWNWSVVDDNNVNIIQGAFEYLTSDKFNSASFSGGKWVNSVASDQDNVMLWTNKDGQSLKMLAYPTATMWKWNDGKNTVFTDKYTFNISSDGMTLNVMKDGQNFVSFRASKK